MYAHYNSLNDEIMFKIELILIGNVMHLSVT